MEFRLLGPVEVWVAGRPVDLGSVKRRTILAALLLEVNQPVPIDRLIELIWDADPPQRARNVIQGHLSRIRRILLDAGAEQAGVAVDTRSPGYVLYADPELIDAHRFLRLVREAGPAADPDAVELLSQALALWRGPALIGQPRAEELGATLAEARQLAMEQYADAALRLGRSQQLLGDLTELAVAYPLREGLVSRLMTALARAGRQADAIDWYNRTRRRLAEDLGVDPGPDLASAFQAVLNSTAAPSSPRPVTLDAPAAEPPAASGNAPVPAQLPPDVSHFTGHRVEFAALLISGERTGSPEAVPVSAIVGPGGVGKTALAVHAAHRLAALFPDGQLFLDLQGFAEAEPRNAHAALGILLRALGVPARQVPADTAERTALYRSRLAGKRMLILLDNAGSSAQVRPLLPGSSACFTLVTSRRQLDGLVARDGAVQLTLDTLDQAAGVELLARLIGPQRCAAEPRACARLVDLAGRLPLALRILAARANSAPDRPIAQLVSALADRRLHLDRLSTDDGDTSVRSALLLSYQTLSPPSARVFRLMGLLPGASLPPYLVAALAGCSPAGAESVLGALAAVHLVQRGASGRYGMHDLVAHHAVERLIEDEPVTERRAALARLADCCLLTIGKAERAVSPDMPMPEYRVEHVPAVPLEFATPADADGWLDTEQETLRAVIRVVAEYGLHERAWQLIHAQWPLTERNELWQEAVSLGELGVDAARATGDARAELRMLRYRSLAYSSLSQHQDAARAGRDLVTIAERLHSPEDMTAALLSLAGIHWRAGEHEDAVDCLLRSLSLAQRHELRYREAQVLSKLSCVRLDQGRPHDAMVDARRAVECSARLAAPQIEGQALINLGNALRQLGEFDAALVEYRRALPLVQRGGIRVAEAEVLYMMGHALAHVQGPAAAQVPWRRALTLYTELGRPEADEVAYELAGC